MADDDDDAGKAEERGEALCCSTGEQDEAGGTPLESSSEESLCGICYNPFDGGLHSPCLLGCLHTFCLQCLSQLQQQQQQPDRRGVSITLTCPLCRQRTLLPDGRLLSLAAPGEAQSPLPPLYRLQPPLPPAAPQRPQQEQSGPWTAPSADTGAGSGPAALRCCCRRGWKPPELLGSKRWLLACFFFVVLFSAAGGIGLYCLNFGPGYILLTASIFFLSVAWCFKGATEMHAQETLLRRGLDGSSTACAQAEPQEGCRC